jgi:hypothetical protein
MRRFVCLAFTVPLGLAFVLGHRPAEAGLVTQTVSTPAGGTATDFSLSLAVPTFDRGLGTLQSMTIRFNDSATMQGWVMNTAPVIESFQVIESSTFSLSYQGQQMLSNTLGAQGNCVDMAGGEVGSFGVHQASGSSNPMTMTSGAMFNLFDSASGNVDLNFSSLTSTESIGGGGNASTGIYTTAFATVSVTYDYISASISVPEPTSLALSLIGGGVVTAALRWRSRPGWRADRRNRRKTVDSSFRLG